MREGVGVVRGLVVQGAAASFGVVIGLQGVMISLVPADSLDIRLTTKVLALEDGSQPRTRDENMRLGDSTRRTDAIDIPEPGNVAGAERALHAAGEPESD